MSTVQMCAKSTFAFDGAVKRARQYLKKTGRVHQIQHLPSVYPQYRHQLAAIDVAVRAKILKCHLEDTYGHDNIFSVTITRRKGKCTILVCHDVLGDTENISRITEMYEDDSTKVVLETFSSGISRGGSHSV